MTADVCLDGKLHCLTGQPYTWSSRSVDDIRSRSASAETESHGIVD